MYTGKFYYRYSRSILFYRYRIKKIARKYNPDLRNEGYQKRKKDTNIFDGTDGVSKILDWLVTLKGEPRRVKNENIEYDLRSIDHIDSAFNTYVVMNGLSNWQKIVNIIRIGNGIISLKNFNRIIKISGNNYVPRHINFRF